MMRSRHAGRVDQAPIAEVIDRARRIGAFTVEGVRGGKHRLDASARPSERWRIAQVARDNLGAERLYTRQLRRRAAQRAHGDALRQQSPRDDSSKATGRPYD